MNKSQQVKFELAGRPSSDAARPQINRRISITSHGDRTVPASSTRPLLRNQHFAMVTSDLEASVKSRVNPWK